MQDYNGDNTGRLSRGVPQVDCWTHAVQLTFSILLLYSDIIWRNPPMSRNFVTGIRLVTATVLCLKLSCPKSIVFILCTTRLHHVYGISWSPRRWSRLRTWWLSTQRNFRPSCNPQAGGLPIVRCLQLRRTFSSNIRVLGLHPTLQLEGYPLSDVSTYLHDTFASVIRDLGLHPTSKL